MSYSDYDMSPEALEYRRAIRHQQVHQPHPEFPHRHADRCHECAALRDEMDAEPATLRRRLEAMLETLEDRGQETILDAPSVDREGTTHYHRLTATDIRTLTALLPED